MEETRDGTLEIKSESFSDQHCNSDLLNLLPENCAQLRNRPLIEGFELCSIEKEDPELFDASQFMVANVVKTYQDQYTEENIYVRYDKIKYNPLDVLPQTFHTEFTSDENDKQQIKTIQSGESCSQKETNELHEQCKQCKVVLKGNVNQELLLKAHAISDLPHNQMLKCNICSQQFEIRDHLRLHVESKHDMISGSFNKGQYTYNNSDTDIGAIENIQNELQEMPDKSDCHTSEQYTDNVASENIQDVELNEDDNTLECLKTQVFNGSENIDTLKKYMIRLCPVCGLEFEMCRKSWNMHVDSAHDFTNSLVRSYNITDKTTNRQCNECKIILKAKSQRSLITHKITHLPYKQIYKCKICVKKLTTFSALRIHIERDHLDVMSSDIPSLAAIRTGEYCVFCEKNVRFKEKLFVHMQKEHKYICKNKILLVCPECGVKYTNEASYRSHVSTVHSFSYDLGLSFDEIVESTDTEVNITKFRCKKCDLLFPTCSNIVLRNHYITHLPHKQYKCRYCDFTEKSRHKILIHSCKVLLDVFKSAPKSKDITKSNQLPNLNLLNRNLIDKTDKLYVCPCCGEEFDTEALHEQHLKGAHKFEKFKSLNITACKEDKNINYICNVCNHGFKTPNMHSFRSHAFTHFPFKLYKCALCNTSSKNLSICLCKKSGLLNNILFICPKCNIEPFNSEKEWLAHIQEYHADATTLVGLNFEQIVAENGENITYKCCKCGKIMKKLQLNDMLLHAVEHISDKCFKCKVCERSYNCKGDVFRDVYNCIHTKYVKFHGNEAVFDKNWHSCLKFAKCQCPVCGFTDENDKDIELARHLWQTHSLNLQSEECLNFIQYEDKDNTSSKYKKIFKCVQCNELLTKCSIMMLQEHSLAHLPYRMWSCTFCGKEFNSKAPTLNHFMNFHFKQESKREEDLNHLILFICPICNEKFNLHRRWQVHVESKHSLKDYIGQKFDNVGNLLKCVDCNSFVNKRNKLSHCLRHLAFPPYRCRVCNYAFRTLKGARGHAIFCREKRTCSGNLENSKNNKTKLCDLVDKGNRNVEKQKNVLLKNKLIAYACPECNISLPTEEHWYTHVNDKHSFFSKYLNIEDIPGKKLLGLCLECNKEVTGNGRLREEHKLRHMPFASFICKICRHRSKRKGDLLDHMSRKHFAAVEVICEICSQACKTHYDFSNHMNKEHCDIESWPMNLCPICLNIFDNIALHVKTNHLPEDIEKYEIETNGRLSRMFVFNEQDGLLIQNHSNAPLLTHISSETILPDSRPSDSYVSFDAEETQVITSMAICSSKSTVLNKFFPYITYACPECNIPLSTQKEWHYHITANHDFFASHSLNIKDESGKSKHSICLECGAKLYGQLLHKQRHKLTHMPYASFVCTICLHRSKTQNVLFGHIQRKHFTFGEFKCEMCSLVYKTAFERYNHAKTQHKDIVWPKNVCPICVATINVRSMDCHIKTHDRDREKFPCGYCKKNYLSQSERTKHLRLEHPSESKTETLAKQPEKTIFTNSQSSKNLENVKIELKTIEEFIPRNQNLNENKQEGQNNYEVFPSTSNVIKIRSKTTKVPESATGFDSFPNYTSHLNNSLTPSSRKRGRPKKLQNEDLLAPLGRKREKPRKLQTKVDSCTSYLSEFVTSLQKKNTKKKKIERPKRSFVDWSNEESDSN